MQSIRSRRFACHTLSCSLAMVVGCCVTRAAHADDARSLQGELASAETAIAVVAGEHAPRLTVLKARGATAWKNRADETLPEQVEVHGAAQSVVWRLDRSASHFESNQIQLVYFAAAPAGVAVARARQPRPARAHRIDSEPEQRAGVVAAAAELSF
jgi:hypothetical protein